MSMVMTMVRRPSLPKPDPHRPFRRPEGLRQRRLRPPVDPGPTPGAAPLLRFLHRGECIPGALGPTDSDHYYMVRVDAGAILRIALGVTGGVAGLQLIRLPEGPGDGRVDPEDILMTTSTLVTNPTALAPTLPPGYYLVRVYSFFEDSDDYLLELELRPTTRALVVLDGHRRGPLGEGREPADAVAGPVPVSSSRQPGGNEQVGHSPGDSRRIQRLYVIAQAGVPFRRTRCSIARLAPRPAWGTSS